MSEGIACIAVGFPFLFIFWFVGVKVIEAATICRWLPILCCPFPWLSVLDSKTKCVLGLKCMFRFGCCALSSLHIWVLIFLSSFPLSPLSYGLCLWYGLRRLIYLRYGGSRFFVFSSFIAGALRTSIGTLRLMIFWSCMRFAINSTQQLSFYAAKLYYHSNVML